MYIVNKDGVKVSIKSVHASEFTSYNPLGFVTKPRGEKYKGLGVMQGNTYYNQTPIFLDTETSNDGEKGWIHQWSMCIGNCELFVYGRRVEELVSVLEVITKGSKKYRGQHSNHKAKQFTVIYVHNLSYDWQYFKEFIPSHEIFAVKSHKLLTARYPGIEFRCSYLLTGKSLAKWGKDNNSEYQKLEDTYDYSRVITPDEKLSESDWTYQLNDVATQACNWYQDRKNDGFNTATVPLTSTGFVRNHVRELANNTFGWKELVTRLSPGAEYNSWFEKAFQAGYTHGNRFRGEVITEPVGHRDFKSSYPARMEINTFPMGEWFHIKPTKEQLTKEFFKRNCVVMRCILHDIKLKDWAITAPCIPRSKLEPIGKINVSLDNGRILAMQGVAVYYVTELDYMLMTEQYTGDILVVEALVSKRGKLPQEFRELIMKDFINKTLLDPKKNPNSDFILYMLSKARVNAYFGMCATKVLQENQKYNPDTGEWTHETPPTTKYDKAIEKAIVPFCWAIYITAWARWELFNAIKSAGYWSFLYCDTDSIFYTLENEERVEKYNQECIARAKRHTAFYDDAYLGAFEMESDAPCMKFVQLHAKCYAYHDNQDKLNVVVAGVNKKRTRFINGEKVTKSNADELGNIEKLMNGFCFSWCGGTAITYQESKPHYEYINGCRVAIGGSAIIKDSTYIVHDTRNNGVLSSWDEEFWNDACDIPEEAI